MTKLGGVHRIVAIKESHNFYCVYWLVVGKFDFNENSAAQIEPGLVKFGCHVLVMVKCLKNVVEKIPVSVLRVKLFSNQ